MIKITSVEIDGFIVPSQKVKLDFVESNVVCIYGNNGAGKTSFLEILFAVFDRDEKILEKYNVDSIKISYMNSDIEIKENIIMKINNLVDEKEIKVEDKKLKLSEKYDNKKLLLINQANELNLKISNKFDGLKEKLENNLEIKKKQLKQEEKKSIERNNQVFEKFKQNENYKKLDNELKEEKANENKNTLFEIEKEYKKKIISLQEKYKDEIETLEKEKIKENNSINRNLEENNNKLSVKYEQELNLILMDMEIKIQKKQDELAQISQIYSLSISKREKPKDNEDYNWDRFNVSELHSLSTLFLGIGRGIHKNELKIPKEMIWHFFRNNKKISENKTLTGNEIDEFSDRLIEHLTPKDKNNEIEIYRARELDDKKNIYLPNIDIDTIEAFLKIKYKDAVLDAKEKIEKVLSKTSLNFFQPTISTEIDLEELREKLLYNKTLLLEMFSDTENIGIKTVFDSLNDNESFLKEMDSSKQTILFNMVKELQNEVELFKEIQTFLYEYNQFLNYDKNLVLSENGIYITPKNHSIYKLSSGERHLLTFLATILLMGEEQDFILIDEPEISLNVMWQKKILNTISKLAPNSQIIVATHSPLITRGQKVLVGLVPKEL